MFQLTKGLLQERVCSEAETSTMVRVLDVYICLTIRYWGTFCGTKAVRFSSNSL